MRAIEAEQNWQGELLPLPKKNAPFETWEHLRGLVDKALNNLGINRRDIKKMQTNAQLDSIMFAGDEDWTEFIPLPATGVNSYTREVIARLAMADGVVVHEETVTWSVGDTVFVAERLLETEAA